MLPELPLDVLINVFMLLPASRDRREISARTLAACLQTNSLFRQAASLPSLWKPHYQIRYEHDDEERESARRQAEEDNWRLLYAKRRQIDCHAMRLLDDIVTKRVGRQATSLSLITLSMDIWDFLELESDCPIPVPFANDADYAEGEKIPDHAITRRFWANSILVTISRGHAVSGWTCRYSSDPKPSFEEIMSLLSCFFGFSERRITAQLDELAGKCREELDKQGVCLDHGQQNYDLANVCREIWTFMRKEGFTLATDTEYENVLNSFPHIYLTTNRKTIPISLVHIFASIGTRLGLSVSPVNFPGTVLANVQPREPNAHHIIVNPSASDPRQAVSDLMTANPVPLTLALHPNANIQEFLQPCSDILMLLRASRNILSSLMAVRDVPPSATHPAMLVPICTHFLFQADDRALTTLMSDVEMQPLDCMFLLNELAPVLPERCKTILHARCDDILDKAAVDETIVHKRSSTGAKYFVGMAFIHDQQGYLGFIWGWDKICKATDDWMLLMTIDTLRRGRNQPFYHVFSFDGSQRYVAEENIQPATFTPVHVQSIYSNFPSFPLYFGGVELPRDLGKGVEHRDGRGRLLLNPHALHAYPDDDHVGSLWVEHGSSPM